MELKHLKSYLLTHTIDYVPKSIITRHIVKKQIGNVSIFALDKGETVTAKVLAFDNLIQIIDGAADMIIGAKSIHLTTGQVIIIPAHTPNTIKANERFKMLSTIIKSGYEEVDI